MATPHELRDKGLRLTPQRELVLHAVREIGHATAEQVADKVKVTHPGINLSTVYRNLERLESVGLVQHTHLGHGGVTYHPTEEDVHLHMHCEKCGKLFEAPVEVASNFVQNVFDEYNFHVDVAHLAISGRCEDCFNKD